MLSRTNLQADLSAIRSLVTEVEPLFKGNRLYVTARPGAADPLHDGTGWLPEGESEADFTEITPPFRGTAVEALLKSLPCRYGRARLMSRFRFRSFESSDASPGTAGFLT